MHSAKKNFHCSHATFTNDVAALMLQEKCSVGPNMLCRGSLLGYRKKPDFNRLTEGMTRHYERSFTESKIWALQGFLSVGH